MGYRHSRQEHPTQAGVWENSLQWYLSWSLIPCFWDWKTALHIFILRGISLWLHTLDRIAEWFSSQKPMTIPQDSLYKLTRSHNSLTGASVVVCCCFVFWSFCLFWSLCHHCHQRRVQPPVPSLRERGGLPSGHVAWRRWNVKRSVCSLMRGENDRQTPFPHCPLARYTCVWASSFSPSVCADERAVCPWHTTVSLFLNCKHRETERSTLGLNSWPPVTGGVVVKTRQAQHTWTAAKLLISFGINKVSLLSHMVRGAGNLSTGAGSGYTVASYRPTVARYEPTALTVLSLKHHGSRGFGIAV